MIRTKEIQSPVLQRSGERSLSGQGDRKLPKEGSARVGLSYGTCTGPPPPRLRDTINICGIKLHEKDQEANGQHRVSCTKDRVPVTNDNDAQRWRRA